MAEEGKSGLRQLKPGEVLFHDGDVANSLYIIQKGQLRLFKPKGKGFIEIAVLRSGEVIGEMAYFDKDGGKRSCSASAMVSSDVIEISFAAFSKTMQGLNPWFKTIINTLAERLRQTNQRVKTLESNSASVDYGTGKHKGYEFLKAHDVIKILGVIFLVYRAHGEPSEGGLTINKGTLNLYGHDIFNIMEAKTEEMMIILQDLKMLKITNDKEGNPNIYTLRDLDDLRSIFIFFNADKQLPEDSKLKVSSKCLTFLEEIWRQIKDRPNAEEVKTVVDIAPMLKRWREQKEFITAEHLEDARAHAIVDEVMVTDSGEELLEVSFLKLQKSLPNLRFLARVDQSNRDKSDF